MKKKIFQRILIGLSATVFSLMVILGYHIYSVTHRPHSTENNKQLSRIDFLQPIDTTEALHIRYQVASMPGVESTYFNHASNILVYTYAPEKQNSLNVFTTLMKSGKYRAQRYVVEASAASNGCPIGADNQSVSGKATSYPSSLFH